MVSWEQFLRVVCLHDYNTRVVVIGVVLLGLSAGVIGSFMLLRKRALVGDAVSHATFPGICIAFMVMAAFGGDGKFLPGLLLGALISGLLGMMCILWIRTYSRLKEDAALGIVLSVFFGLGVALRGLIQKMSHGHAAGLDSFIYGKTASMLAADARLIAVTALVVVTIAFLLFKEFRLLCFDQAFAATQGWPVFILDMLMMGLVVTVTVIGLQAVGLILMIALLIIPPAAARFWTENLNVMVWSSAVIGAISGFVGALMSALVPRLPAGAVIVVIASIVFLFSMVFGKRRGVWVRVIDHVRLNRRIAHQHLLRAIYEWSEPSGGLDGMPLSELMSARSWTPPTLNRVLAASIRKGEVVRVSKDRYSLTSDGESEARKMVRCHRLWELYLIHHADIAPSHVDRDADQIEHILDGDMVDELERLLALERPDLTVPPCPHEM